MTPIAPSAARSLAAALAGPCAQGATGAIVVAARAETHNIYVRGGSVVHVDLQNGQEPLGMVLAETGLLSLCDVQRSLRRRPDHLYGVTLVRESFLSAEGVLRGLRAQMARRAARIYGLDDARFRFEADALPAAALATPSARLHPLELLCLAARHPRAAQRSLARILPLKAHRLRLRMRQDAIAALPALREAFCEAEWSALDALAQGTRLGELITSGLLSAVAASALVEPLLVWGALDVHAPGAEATRIFVGTAARARTAPAEDAPPRAKANAGPARPAERLVADVRAETRRGGNPWRLLGLAPGATVEALRGAYRSRALELHPDRWATGTAPADLSQLFAAVSSAYRTLLASVAQSDAPPLRRAAS
jgi:hypothetical protein